MIPIAQTPVSEADLAANLAEIQQRIQDAALKAARDPKSIRLLPVSKTKSNEVLRMAYAVGVREFGENKVQEAKQKSEDLADLSDARWCVIGHLQTNKAKYVARFAHEFQALDNLRVASELDKCLKKEGRTLDVFVQVNSSDEPQKFGLPPSDVEAFIAQLPKFSSLKIKGLMTLAEFSSSETRVRECFVRMRNLQEKLKANLPDGISLKELSMGMSGDFELAIAEGATVVRVGQAIFGARNTLDSFYWPN